MHADDGPPCTLTTSGYVLPDVLPGAKFLGSISQPCTRVLPFCQWILRFAPHDGSRPSFRCVICFQVPIAPAQTSGGVLADWRVTAVTVPSRENDPLA